MTTRHYLYPEGISLHKDKLCNGKKIYAFGICGGESHISVYKTGADPRKSRIASNDYIGCYPEKVGFVYNRV